MHRANLPSLLTLTWTIVLVAHLPLALNAPVQRSMSWKSLEPGVCGPDVEVALCCKFQNSHSVPLSKSIFVPQIIILLVLIFVIANNMYVINDWLCVV